ncbi:hypothetical protein [Spongiimicrobium sp. 3-5]|uniref:hypothetical protein n=1 Tax=Spongiimicrobium sp. 3-5 TaxID=3332596 RepID=UPI0039805C4B
MGFTKIILPVCFILSSLGTSNDISYNNINIPKVSRVSPELSLPEEKSFDFWVGKWHASWDEGDGKIGKATNKITKILDSKVIKEDFRITEGQGKGFKGISISIYQPKLKRWKQAWADNQGGYYDLIGEFDDDKRIFKTQVVEKDGKKIVSRMVFMDIKKNSFTWDWESSYDGGKTWKLLWRIKYERAL